MKLVDEKPQAKIDEPDTAPRRGARSLTAELTMRAAARIRMQSARTARIARTHGCSRARSDPGEHRESHEHDHQTDQDRPALRTPLVILVGHASSRCCRRSEHTVIPSPVPRVSGERRRPAGKRGFSGKIAAHHVLLIERIPHDARPDAAVARRTANRFALGARYSRCRRSMRAPASCRTT